MDKKKSVVLYLADIIAVLSSLKMKQRGIFITALCNKNFFGAYKIDVTDDAIIQGLELIQNDIDINNEKYAEALEKRRLNGSKGGKKRAENYKQHLNLLEVKPKQLSSKNSKFNANLLKQNEEGDDNESVNENESESEFVNDQDKESVPVDKLGTAQYPTVDEVANYCKESGYTIDPLAFVKWNTKRGWMNGKKCIVLDWRKAVRKWFCKENHLVYEDMEQMSDICADVLAKVKG